MGNEVIAGTYKGAGDSISRAPEPSEASGPAGLGTVRCRRCGWEGEPAGKGQCPECGCFVASNVVALRHGGRRLQSGQGSALEEARRQEIRAAIYQDLGGEAEVSEVVRHLVEDFAAAVLLRDACWHHLQEVGPFTRSGKRRAAVDLWRESSVRVERLAARIGTERRQRPTDTLEAWARRQAREGGASP